MNHYLTIAGSFRTGQILPPIDEQYADLWKFAGSVEQHAGIPLDDWYLPPGSERDPLVNRAFTATGPSIAAMAQARGDRENLATDLRTLGVWNGKEDDGGASFSATYTIGRTHGNLRFQAKNCSALLDWQNVSCVVVSIVKCWRPITVAAGPGGYANTSVFEDRPPVGWMLYLPFEIAASRLPEAARLISVVDDESKSVLGTVIVAVTETFALGNPEHIARANAIETRLVGQDLLPTSRELLTRY